MYGKIMFAEMYNKSVSINGSRCLISYVNIVVLIIKMQNTIQNELLAAFVSLEVFVYSTILALILPGRFADSYGPPSSVNNFSSIVNNWSSAS
jgi:hypothetical protein